MLIETMSDSYELKAAVLAAREARIQAGYRGTPACVRNRYI